MTSSGFNQIRNSNIVRRESDEANFFDNSLWEPAKLNGDRAIQALIDAGLKRSSVTAVLVGAETYGRQWVNYEIEESWKRGNKLLGIYIHNLRDSTQRTDVKGRNPFEYFTINGTQLSQYVPMHDWIQEDGYNNFGRWIESSPEYPGRY